MKIKRFLPICLLMGSFILTSCDLLDNLMGGHKKKDSESGEKVAYQGKQGATELSKEEWEQAFSLEELALRRNCHLEVSQEQTQVNMDIDNGKFKMDVPYSDQPVYFHFTEVDSSNNVAGTYYSPDGNGGYNSGADKETLDLTMAQFGVIYLKYESFKYDSSSKMYKADNYKYEISYQGQTALSLDCSDCKVTIEDGFPKKLECNIVEGGNGQSEEQPEPMHYEANFSRYNAITVELPQAGENGNNGNGGNSSLPDIKGNEITYDQLYSKFVERATPGYLHASLKVTVDDGEGNTQSMTITATKVEGTWVMDNEEFNEVDLNSMIITEEMMQELAEEAKDPGINLHFYTNNEKTGYIITMSESYINLESGVNEQTDIQLYLDQYFYVTAEYVNSNGSYTAMEITWSF